MGIISGNYPLDSKLLSFINQSNESKSPTDPLALYLIGSFDKKGEMNPNLNSHVLRFKQIAKTYYLSIQVMNDANIGSAIERVKKAYPDRPIDLLVAQMHGRIDALGFTEDASGHYTLERAKSEDFSLLSSRCVIYLNGCNAYAPLMESIAAKIAEVSKRVVFAATAFLHLDHFFFLPGREISWVAFDKTFTTPISVKLEYDEGLKKVVETPASPNALEEISEKLASDANKGCIDSQMVFGHLMASTRKMDEAASYYKMAITNKNSLSKVNFDFFLKRIEKNPELAMSVLAHRF